MGSVIADVDILTILAFCDGAAPKGRSPCCLFIKLLYLCCYIKKRIVMALLALRRCPLDRNWSSRIIELLESVGGKNVFGLRGDEEYAFGIDESGVIVGLFAAEDNMRYQVFDENFFAETYPWMRGTCFAGPTGICTICGKRWDPERECVFYDVRERDGGVYRNLRADEIAPFFEH